MTRIPSTYSIQSDFSRALYSSPSGSGSSPRFGALSLRKLAEAAVGTVVPVPPVYQQFVYETAGGREVQVYVPSDMLAQEMAPARTEAHQLNHLA